MASIIFTAKDIFDQDFKREVRGYSKDEVNEFLDDVIKDYETYAALVKELREENARLREELAQKAQETPQTPQTSPIVSTATQEFPQVTTATNFDILKRLNRLEKEVFGKQIVDRDY
ncbi:MAG: cell division regulator GpsB [Streptococcus parasanguinis]